MSDTTFTTPCFVYNTDILKERINTVKKTLNIGYGEKNVLGAYIFNKIKFICYTRNFV